MSTTTLCRHCLGELPFGLRVAFFETEGSTAPLMGDFCCVSHAIAAFDNAVEAEQMPASMFLGVHVSKDGHDRRALNQIMIEIAKHMAAGDGTIELPQRKPGALSRLN